ncbi:TPA: hypothetical protein EYO57_28435 [Candidatus Poribacteria bacterium]|nr:hypothetical protein [Candidatus Poribacteria bacterium]
MSGAERTRERVRTQENEESVDWDVQYEAYLKENPGVVKAVASGKISKENIIAGIKNRMEDLSPSDEEHLEMLWKIRRRIGFDPEEGRPTKKEWMPHLKKGLAELRSRPKTTGHAGSELRGTLEYMARWTDEQLTREEAELKKQAKAGGYLKQVLRAIETTLIEIHIEGNHFEIDPEVSLRLQKLGLTNEQVTLVVGIAQMGWYQTVAKNMGSPLLKYKNGIAEGRQVFESGHMSDLWLPGIFRGIRVTAL